MSMTIAPFPWYPGVYLLTPKGRFLNLGFQEKTIPWNRKTCWAWHLKQNLWVQMHIFVYDNILTDICYALRLKES